SAASVFRNVSATTVMRCEGRQKCSLHLRISTHLQLTATVHGVSICVATMGMMPMCRTLTFTKASRAKMSGMQVYVMDDCTQVSPSQYFEIKVQTVPSYCGVVWTGAYVAPAGRLFYDINDETKEVAVSVSDMLEGHDYHLRLCHKDFICSDTGAKTLIRKEEPVKKVLLQYSRALPCLCIEGWSAVTDASRVQVCPFKDRESWLEELWFGISFQPLEGQLWWEPACPVAATVTLCHSREEMCVDLPHSSQNVSKRKITFNRVDPHPRLCVKFTVGSRSWIRCPFADSQF
uniref:Interleukin-17 receptor C/E N-terminal domain-containing protein n=1 Tax=Tetraodon nigroviridis TaxID=99883 RepID=H3C3Z3_TETNG